ncbi:hypothetical protein [Planctomicrobium sp. SH527]|uniref:hypothetical protein n=1 Tax=Planctomicrobium sp. SH527 TaxID=3448123 RepID=UPI003F5B17C0
MKTITIDAVTTNPEHAKPQIETVSRRPDFEHPESRPKSEALAIKKKRRPGIWYVNPVGTVYAAVDSADFLNAVRKKQREWFRLLSRRFKNGWRSERKKASTEELDYGYDGVIILKGMILRLKWWSKQRLTNPELNIYGNQESSSNMGSSKRIYGCKKDSGGKTSD